ncbi:MAG TPA: type III pantothenate kinase [Dehalococcoidia bacterium]|nr:type III pantothenate kinase [Dehalococcoidia bacterium]
MLLAIDIGNTNITFGVFDQERLIATWRLASDRERLADEYAVIMLQLLATEGIDRNSISRAVLTSGVPLLTTVIEEMCRRYFHVTPLRVGAGIKTGLRILYEDPREVGPDRIVDAVAALRMHKPPLIVVDLGTATVFDVVSREGDYLGGAIAPGIGLATDALVSRAAMLRRIELKAPRHVIGNNTTTAMQSGVIFGYVCLVEGMVKRIKAEIGEDAWVVGTGGWAEVIARETRVFDHLDPNLTLTGLRLVYEMNEGVPRGEG